MNRMAFVGWLAAVAGLLSAACMAATCIVADPNGHVVNGGTPLSGETHSVSGVQAVFVDSAANYAGVSSALFVDAKTTDDGESNGILVLSLPPTGFIIFVN